MQDPDSKPAQRDILSGRLDDGAMSVYDDIAIEGEQPAPTQQEGELPADAQDNYFERREPGQLIFCIMLSAAYAGLAKYIWVPLQASGHWMDFVRVEGLFITLSALSLLLGLRPYLSPSSLQMSKLGLKYRGPHWPQRKTINWSQLYRLWLSPDLVIVLYHPPTNPRGMRLLFIQCNYLSDRSKISERFAKYSPVAPVYLRNPQWWVKAIFFVGYFAVVCWILYMLGVGSL